MEAHTGTILWKQYMVPDNHGEVGFYSGAAVWGSSPAIDIAHNTIYIATGNDYSVPPEITACQAQHNNSVLPDPCFKPGDLQESVVALDREETIRDVLAVGQKSGVVWLLDRLNGSVIWATVRILFSLYSFSQSPRTKGLFPLGCWDRSTIHTLCCT
jgi:glucose dehydrogenase